VVKTDNAAILIRLNKLTREEGMKLVKEFEGKIPDRYLDEFLEQWDMSREEFFKIADKFTNKELFKKNPDAAFYRDKFGNLEKTNYDNIE